MRLLVLAILLTGCPNPRAAPASPEARPSPLDAGTSWDAATPPAKASPPVEAPPVEPPALGKLQSSFGDCIGTRDGETQCKKLGPQCRLEARPELAPPSPCRNRGARCLDMPKQAPAKGECLCTCSSEYKTSRMRVESERAQRRRPPPSLRDPKKDAICARQAKLKAAGKDVPVCADEGDLGLRDLPK